VRTAHLAALALCLLAGGCTSGKSEGMPPAWQEMVAPPTGEALMLELVAISLEKLDFPIGTGFNPDDLTITTGWRKSLAPFKGAGYRLRASVQLAPVLEGDARVAAGEIEVGAYDIRVRVEKQTNEALVRQLDPQYAEWEWAPDDEATAQVILQHIRSRLQPTLEVDAPPPDPLERWK
jgi:hypothetical protein